MKRVKMLLSVLLSVSVVIFFTGCDKEADNGDEGPTIDSLKSIPMKSSGEEVTIQFAHSTWKIMSIIDKSNNEKIKGDIFTIDNQIIGEGELLSLDGLGRLEAKWDDKGFVITREIPARLKIEVSENNSGKDFVFAIVIETDNVREEYVIDQKAK